MFGEGEGNKSQPNTKVRNVLAVSLRRVRKS